MRGSAISASRRRCQRIGSTDRLARRPPPLPAPVGVANSILRSEAPSATRSRRPGHRPGLRRRPRDDGPAAQGRVRRGADPGQLGFQPLEPRRSTSLIRSPSGMRPARPADVRRTRSQGHDIRRAPARETQAPIRTVPVVVVDEGSHHPLEVPAVGDHDPVEALPSHGCRRSARRTRLPWTLRRGWRSDPDAIGSETWSKLRLNLASLSRRRSAEDDRARRIPTHTRFRACWATPRFRRDSRPHLPGGPDGWRPR